MFKIKGHLDEYISEAKKSTSANLLIISPANNPATAHLFVGKGYKPDFSRIEIDFFVTRWDLTPKGMGLLKIAGFSPRQTGVKKEDIPKGKEKEWLQILSGILSLDDMFVTRSNLI